MEKKHLAEVLPGERITLKKHDLSLAQTMFDYVEEDRARLREFLPWVDFTKTVQDEVNFINMMSDKWTKFENFGYSIFRNSDNTFMGIIDIHSIKWGAGCGEIGYWILGKFEGQGYMAEAVRVLEQAAFNLGFHRMEIRCSSLNEKSARIPQRCGYTLDGRLREDRFENGRYGDTMIFAKLKSEAK